jgi:hypothetical protein
MKLPLATWCVVLLCLLVPRGAAADNAESTSPHPVHYVIGLSPFLEDHTKDPLFRELIGFVLEELPLQSSLWICDAFHLRTITRIEVPNLGAFRSAKTRANQFREPIRKLKSFLAEKHPQPEAAGLTFDQAIRFPQFLDFVSDHLGGSAQDAVVMVLGSPLYLDAKEPGFSMVHGYYPSDGHLRASRDQSVFGLETRGDALRGVVVHYGWFGDPWVSEAHQQRIDRFWTLYLRGQGGELATFCGDLPTVFSAWAARAPASEARQQRHPLAPEDTRIEMLRLTREVGATDWITREVLPRVQHAPPTSTVGVMKIGIRWQGDIDLDLYAQPHRQAEPLFFEHVRSPEGYYFKDHRSSPDREYEFIEFESPVDVWKVDARINFYEGRAPGGPSGEVRIEFEGKIFTGAFQLEADQGNRGRSGRDQHRFWSAIDIPAILKLRSAEP